MKHEDVTIVMQGPIGEGLTYLDNYLNLVGRVIVSTWNNRVEIKNATLVTDDIKKYENYYSNANICYQAASSLNGMKQVNTKYAIKVRCDEYYTDLSKFIELVKSDPEKLTTHNFLFTPNNLEQFHPSDHVAGGYTHNILGMYQTALEFCKKLPAGTDPIHCSQLGIEGYRNIYDNGLVSPESFLCICFLINKGINIDCSKSKKIMKDNVQLLPLHEMGNFLCKIKGQSVTNYESFLSSTYGRDSIESMELL